MRSARRSLGAGHPLLVAVLLAVGTAALVWGNAARVEAHTVRSSAEASQADLTAEAEVVEVTRHYGQPVAVVRFDPPEGAARALTVGGTPLPTVERAYLGDVEAAPGDTLTVALSPLQDIPTVDVDQALAAADRVRTIANTAQGFAVVAYLAALILLIGLFRQQDVSYIRAETTRRHGGA